VGFLKCDRKFGAAVQLEYEANRKYGAHYYYCVATTKKHRVRKFNRLDFDGFMYLPAIGPALAARWVKRIKEQGGILAKDLAREDLVEFLSIIMIPKNEMLIQDYFGSNFAITSLAFYETKPLDDVGVSFLWHCDSGPIQHLKMIIYLNEGHGGGTAVIDRRTTHLFKRAGYVNCPLAYRVNNLDEIAEQFGIKCDASVLCPPAGGAILLEAGSVLHKGMPPVEKPRYVAGLTIIAYPVPWREFIKENYKYLCDNTEAGFGPLVGKHLDIMMEPT